MTEREKEIAEQYFAAYPAESVLHVTSDGQVFLNANHSDAVNHQNGLKFFDVTATLVTLSKKELNSPESEQDSEVEKPVDDLTETVTEPELPAAVDETAPEADQEVPEAEKETKKKKK